MGDRQTLPLADNLDLGKMGAEMPAETFGAKILGTTCDFLEKQLTTPLVSARAIPGDINLSTVVEMGDVLHFKHSTPIERLDEIETEVFQVVDQMCLRVGELLWEAREINPSGFQDWVNERMPFGVDTAKRLSAIFLAYRELPAESVAKLPRPWQAMFALRHWAGGRLDDALESGEIGPTTTVKEAKTKAREWSKEQRTKDPVKPRYTASDLAAGKLMGTDVNEMNEDVFRALTKWTSLRTPAT